MKRRDTCLQKAHISYSDCISITDRYCIDQYSHHSSAALTCWVISFINKWLGDQVARRRSCKPKILGSIPSRASSFLAYVRATHLTKLLESCIDRQVNARSQKVHTTIGHVGSWVWSSKQASVLQLNDMKKLKNEMRWKMNKQYEMELI